MGFRSRSPSAAALLKEARPTLATPDSELVDVGGGVGLHPELHDLGELMSRGEAAVCLGVGSGDTTRSHFEAQDRLERASEEEVLSSGWIARQLMTRAGPRPGPLSAIAFGAGPPEALRGASATSVHDTRELVPERPTEVELDALDALYGASEGASLPLARELGEAGRATVEVTRALRALGTTEPPALARYPEGAFGEHLAQAAWLARHREALGIEVISLDQQGWDTHFVQADLVASNAKALGAGLATLRRDLDDDWHETTVVVFTEFGRRVGENVSRGTDHGRASLAPSHSEIGDARRARAARAADAVDVALGLVGQVVVDDVGHLVDVDAARRDVGGDQHAGRAVGEGRQRALSGALGLVAVDRRRVVPARSSCSATRLAPCLVRVKTMARVTPASFRSSLSTWRLSPFSTKSTFWSMTSRRWSRPGVTSTFARVDAACEPASSAMARGMVAEKSSVWRFWAGCGHLSDVVDEAHVEHAVRLVEDEVPRRLRGRRSPARSGRAGGPGVATRMSGRRAQRLSCGRWPTPPKMTVHLSCRWVP
jgi:hypothetical protein